MITYIRKWVITISLIVSCSLLSIICYGCGKDLTTQSYDYHNAYEYFDWGLVRGRLIGSGSVPSDNLQVMGKPYELCIRAAFHDIRDGNITIKNIRMIDVETGEEQILDDIYKGVIKYYSDEKVPNMSIVCIPSFKTLQWDYHTYIIKFDLEVNGKATKLNVPVSLKFEKDYSEKKSNKVWTRLMGI